MLNIRLLGEQVVSDGATGTARTISPRSIGLLAFLVLHAGSPQTRQRIASRFWPDSTDEQALTNLRRELHHLRGVLGAEPALTVTARDLCWRDSPTCRVDVLAFASSRTLARAAARSGDDAGILEHARAAVEEYRGEFLPGGYDDWLLEIRADLETQCVELVDLLREARARTGDLAGAVEAARRRVQLRPWEEVGYRRLMELQGELGDRAGAVSTYHHCASVLERELGIEPDPATRASLNRLLAAAGPATAAPPAPDPATTTRSGIAAAPLVGRAAELAELASRWDAAATGRPSLVLVRGDPGVGKTRLVTEAAERARLQGAVVAGTRCFGTSGQPALSPVADWLRNGTVRSGVATLEPVWQVEVSRLVPSTTARAEPGTGARAMVDAWQRHRFFEGLARALIGVGRPMLLTLDNLHWCDPETLAFVTFLLGLTTDAPVMVAATVRDEDHPEPGLGDWIARMRSTGMLTEIRLGPLDGPQTSRLAEAISGRSLGEDAAHLLHATTGGFPLHVVEAARSAADLDDRPLPFGDLTAVLRGRLGQLGTTAQEMAGLAAAVGRNFTPDLLTEASDLDAGTVVRALDELWRRRIVRELPDGYDFAHDLLRESAYAQVSPPRRWLLHRRVAQVLELHHADGLDAVAAQLAEQYARGGRPERAVDYYRRAAEVAAGTFAHAEAVRLHEQALSVVHTLPAGPDRDRHELAVLEAMTGPLTARSGYSSPQLRDTLERAIRLAESSGRQGSTLTGLVGLWTSQFVRGELAAAHCTAARALALAGDDSALSGPAHFAFGGSAVSLGHPAEALRHLETAEALGSAYSLTVGTRPDVHARAYAAHAHWLLGHDDEALTSAENAVALARTTDNPFSLAVALAYAGITHQLRDDTARLRGTVDELRRLCDRYGFAYYRDWGMVLDGWLGTDPSGLDLARRGITDLEAAEAHARMPYWLSLVADLAARVGAPDTARATLDEALALAHAHDDRWWEPEVMRMRAAYDGPDDAVHRLRSAARTAAEHGSVALVRRCTADLAGRGVPDPAFGVRPVS